MREARGPRLAGRIALALLTLYALAMIAPDVIRIVRPLGSFGLLANSDGLIYDVQGPFDAEDDSPAWKAGIRPGDHLDLQRMRCPPMDSNECATILSLWGVVTYVMPGRQGTFLLKPTEHGQARKVTLIAAPRPVNRVLQLVVALDQIAGVLFVLGAAWLVWIRPGAMTWGFFVYSVYFNPGQVFEFYAWLQQWPRALLAQNVLSCVFQAAGYAGLLLFALRAPVDEVGPRWRALERALPILAAAFLALSLSGLGNVFGYPVESLWRASMIVGFGVGASAIAILIARRRELSPQDYQRIRWVIWGCLIGLPAYLIAELSQETSLIHRLFDVTMPEELAGLLYLVNGVLCLFVVEAIRRPTVINVEIPLRRGTVLGLLLSVPVFFIHEEMNTLNELTGLPDWAWVIVASALVFLISRTHEVVTEFADRLFDRQYLLAERRLAEVAQALERADDLGEIERMMVEEPTASLQLASAAIFREEDGCFRRRGAEGWGPADALVLTGAEPLLEARAEGKPFELRGERFDARNPPLPSGLQRPILGVPVGKARRCFALALYGGHEAGTDLDAKERKLLAELAESAERAYAQAEIEALRQRIRALEIELARPVEPGRRGGAAGVGRATANEKRP